MGNENSKTRWAMLVGTSLPHKLVSLLLALGFVRPAAADGRGPTPHLSSEEVVARMERRFERQYQALRWYEGRRRYVAEHPLLGQPASWLVEEKFLAPEEKELRVLERSGSAIVGSQLFSRLVEVELQTAQGAARRAVELCRRNYRFTFREYDRALGTYLFEVEPRTSNPYLFRGTVWINAEDFAVVRIEGEPAKSHSFWVKKSRFVHEFARFGEFWLPVRHRSEAELRLFGKATLAIDYFDYRWQARQQRR